MNLFGSRKTLIEKKNGENGSSLEAVEVVLVQCNLVDYNINKSLKYYTLLRPINPMLSC